MDEDTDDDMEMLFGNEEELTDQTAVGAHQDPASEAEDEKMDSLQVSLLDASDELVGQTVDEPHQDQAGEADDDNLDSLPDAGDKLVGQTADDDPQEAAGEESDDDMEGLPDGEDDIDWVPDGEDDAMDPYFDDVKGPGKPVLSAQEVQDIIMKDIDDATHDDLLGRTVLNLLNFMRECSETSGVELSRYEFTIAPDWTLRLNDVLSLHYLEGYENEAWFTDNVMHTVLDLDTGKPDDVHIECHLDLFLSEDFGAIWEKQLAAANRGETPELGWPLTDMKETHNRMVAVINPSAAHWVTVEFVRATSSEPAKLLYYNSLPSASEKGPTYNAVTKVLPQVIYLASLRPNSPLAGFDPHKLEAEVVPCPQQYGSFDCGPFALYFATQRIYNKPVWRDLYDDDEKHEFGQYLRRQCAYVLQNNRMGADSLLSLREFLDALQHQEADEAQKERDYEQQREAQEELERALAAEAESLNPKSLAAEAEQALLEQNLNAERVIFSPPVQSKPGLAYVDHPGPGQNLDDDLEAEVDEIESLKKTTTIFERLEYGERSDVKPSIIFIMRWSGGKCGAPFDRDQIKHTAQAWVDLYLRAAGRSDSNPHVIIHAAMYIPTINMPYLDDVDQRKECLGPSEGPVDLPSDTSDNLQLSFDCPLCHYTATDRSVWHLENRVADHIGSHSPRKPAWIMRKQTGGYAVSCQEPGCSAVLNGKCQRYLRKTARAHWGRKHGQKWLKEQGKSLSIKCSCVTCVAAGLTWTTEDFSGRKSKYSKSHDKPKTGFLCPYGDTKTEFFEFGNLYKHLSIVHYNDAVPPGWYRCGYDATDPSTQCWKTFPSHLRLRLTCAFRAKCAWAAAGADCCTEEDDPHSEALMPVHCKKQHGYELWPYTSDGMFKCSRLYPDLEKLSQHEVRVHAVKRNVLPKIR